MFNDKVYPENVVLFLDAKEMHEKRVDLLYQISFYEQKIVDLKKANRIETGVFGSAGKTEWPFRPLPPADDSEKSPIILNEEAGILCRTYITAMVDIIQRHINRCKSEFVK